VVRAIVYETGGDGVQRRICEIEMRDGVVISDHPLGKYIISRPVIDVDSKSEMLTAEDGERFLRGLLAAYSGTRLRVGLEE